MHGAEAARLAAASASSFGDVLGGPAVCLLFVY